MGNSEQIQSKVSYTWEEKKEGADAVFAFCVPALINRNLEFC